MRGDSLRDFYAKTLAVAGLGLLACAGAIVDYWPVNEELPKTPAVAGLVREAPALVQDLTIQIPAPQIREAVQTRPADFITASFASVDSIVGDAAPTVTLEAAPLPEALVVVDATPTPVTGADDEDGVFSLDMPPTTEPVTEESRRAFGDALRRAKQRVAAARLLFNDAMTGFVGAFRKVSPFFTTTAIVPGL